MKSVGEVMAIGRTFQESLQKALRGLEIGTDGLDADRAAARDDDEPRCSRSCACRAGRPAAYVGRCVPRRLTLDERARAVTRIDPWFLAQIEDLVREEEAVARASPRGARRDARARAQAQGFSDSRLAPLLGRPRTRARRAHQAGRPPGLQARRHLRRRVRDVDRRTSTRPTRRSARPSRPIAAQRS